MALYCTEVRTVGTIRRMNPQNDQRSGRNSCCPSVAVVLGLHSAHLIALWIRRTGTEYLQPVLCMNMSIVCSKPVWVLLKRACYRQTSPASRSLNLQIPQCLKIKAPIAMHKPGSERDHKQRMMRGNGTYSPPVRTGATSMTSTVACSLVNGALLDRDKGHAGSRKKSNH